MSVTSACVALLTAVGFMAGTVHAGELHEASKIGNLVKVKTLVAEGVDLDERATNGETALILAILHGQAATADLLIKQGADIQARSARGFAPLHAAAYAGIAEIAALLLDEGAPIDDTENKDGVAPLVIAIEERHREVAKLLIERDADIHVTERYGFTVLSKAVFSGNNEMAAVLKSMGAECESEEALGPFFHPICLAIGQ